MSNNAHVNDDEIEIHQLPEVPTLQAGMMVAVDSQPTGTKSFNLTTALAGKASSDDISALETALASKADASNVYSKDDVDSAIGDIPVITFDEHQGGNIKYIKVDGQSINALTFPNTFDSDFNETSIGHANMKLIGVDDATRTVGSLSITRTDRNNKPHLFMYYNNPGGQENWYWVPAPINDGVLQANQGTIAWGNAVGYVKNVGSLTDAATITATTLNNGFATLSTSQSALTIIDVVGTDEIVNFAIEITPSVNCTLTIQKKVGDNSPVTLKHSVAGGNTLEANKTYQVTAVGNCWTLAAFES